MPIALRLSGPRGAPAALPECWLRLNSVALHRLQLGTVLTVSVDLADNQRHSVGTHTVGGPTLIKLPAGVVAIELALSLPDGYVPCTVGGHPTEQSSVQPPTAAIAGTGPATMLCGNFDIILNQFLRGSQL